MRFGIAILGVGLALSACSPASPDAGNTSTTTQATTTTRTPSNEICLAGDLPFERDGLIAALGGETGDASSLSEIRWDMSATCERLTVSFGAGSGAPATTLGPTAVSVIPFAGVVRVQLPSEITASAIADILFEGSLIHATYVFRDDALLAIDIHAVDGIPISARAFTTTSPATLVVDITRASTDAVPVGVTATSTAVVINPTPGPSQYPIVVKGYVAPGSSSLHVQLLDGGNPVVDRSMALFTHTDTWQFFTSTIEDGPTGALVLFVGTVDGNGRPDTGARVSVTME
jgi:hypothetical protein